MINDECKVLLLGTIPSEESLRRQMPYGHKQNQFWRILFTIFGEEFIDGIEARKSFLLSHRIAQWDVLHSCEGVGSLDSNIKNESPNDFSGLFNKYPNISHICFTSKKAFDFYKKYVGFDDSKTFIVLPSPSPANARMTLDEKIDKWKVLLDILSADSICD